MRSSHFSIPNMHQMLLKVTSVDLLTRTLLVPKKQSHCPNACSGLVFSLEIDLTAEAPTAGEC